MTEHPIKKTLSSGLRKVNAGHKVNKMPKRKRISDEERFQPLSEDNINVIQENVKEKNTLAAEKKAEKALLTYIRTQQHFSVPDTEYWNYDDRLLDDILSHFWFEIKTIEGDDYRVSSLRHLRYSLKRAIKKYKPNKDIIVDKNYMKSQNAFDTKVKQLKKIGKGYVESYKEITPAGMQNLNYIDT